MACLPVFGGPDASVFRTRIDGRTTETDVVRFGTSCTHTYTQYATEATPPPWIVTTIATDEAAATTTTTGKPGGGSAGMARSQAGGSEKTERSREL